MITKKISVAVATYNGEKYIEEQLQSILDQTRKPDEVIIHDDMSTDRTAEIIAGFIDKNNLQDRWKLKINDENIGWQRNFFEAVRETTGDVIFFSDQDDVWLSEKIEYLTDFMEEHNAGCVYGSTVLIDQNGNELGEKRNTHGIDQNLGQIPFDERFNTSIVMGCRMCISREIADIYLKLNNPFPDHDSQCARLALFFSSLWRVEKTVIKYRVHTGNNSGVEAGLREGSTTIEFRINVIRQNIEWLETLKNYQEQQNVRNGNTVSDKQRFMSVLIAKTIHMQCDRLAYLTSTKGMLWCRLFKYRRYYSGIKMMIGDFVYRHRINRLSGRLYRLFHIS